MRAALIRRPVARPTVVRRSVARPTDRPTTDRSTARARLGRALVVAAIGMSTVGAAAGCASSSGGGTGTNYVSGDGTVTLVPAKDRKAQVALSGTTLEGKPVDVASYRGRVVVLNVWGSWCPPCRAEAPAMQAASTKLASSGVVFLGIDTSDPDPAQALAFQKTFGITYPSLSDDGGQALLALQGAVSAKAVPTTLVLDSSGRIAARISGQSAETTLVDLVGDVATGRDRL